MSFSSDGPSVVRRIPPCTSNLRSLSCDCSGASDSFYVSAYVHCRSWKLDWPCRRSHRKLASARSSWASLKPTSLLQSSAQGSASSIHGLGSRWWHGPSFSRAETSDEACSTGDEHLYRAKWSPSSFVTADHSSLGSCAANSPGWTFDRSKMWLWPTCWESED